MKSEQMRYLLEIDSQKSISAAAQVLFLEQAYLSSVLKKAEAELGITIFSRTYNGVQVTPEGEEALALMRKIMSRLDDLQEFSPQTSWTPDPVSIIISPSIAAGLLAGMFSCYRQNIPEGELDIYISNGDEIGSRIIHNDSNLGVTYFRPGNDLERYRNAAARYQIGVEPLISDDLYFVVRKDSPFARYDSLDIDQIQGVNMAVLPHFNLDETEAIYVSFFGPKNNYTIFPSVPLVKQAILHQNMAAILSGFSVHEDNNVSPDEFAVLKLKGTNCSSGLLLCLIQRNADYLSSNERNLAQSIYRYFQELTDKHPEFRLDELPPVS